jgi:hypothetical protein
MNAKVRKFIESLETEEDKEYAYRNYYRNNPLDLIYDKQLEIVTQESKLIPLDPRKRPAQMKILEMVTTAIKNDEPLLLLIPKARRQGVSTIVEAIIYSLCSQQNNRTAMIIADEQKNTDNIFEMTKTFQERLTPLLKPIEKRNNKKELRFKDLYSAITIDTANKTDIGRSWGFQFIHLSEVAHFKNASTIMTAIMQTLPDDMFVFVVLESTGNGIGGYFYDKIKEAQAGLNDYKIFFIPWFEHPKYTKKIPKDIEFKLHTDHPIYGKEKEIAEKFNLSNERMYWRRWCIRNKCDNNLKKFKQEYPATVEECFQASGVYVFDHEQIEAMSELCTPPSVRGKIDKDGNFKINSSNYNLEIWELPQKDWEYRYVIGIDTGGKTDRADYYVATVYDKISKCDVACMRGHYHPFIFADLCVGLGLYYNNAYLSPEINRWAQEKNDNGLALLDHLRDRYDKIYERRVEDSITKKVTKKIGFHTNSRTKSLIINTLHKVLSEFQETGEKFNNIEILKEMKSYIEDADTGEFRATEGAHDDRLMAEGIARYTATELPEPYKLNKDSSANPHKKIDSNDPQDYV